MFGAEHVHNLPRTHAETDWFVNLAAVSNCRFSSDVSRMRKNSLFVCCECEGIVPRLGGAEHVNKLLRNHADSDWFVDPAAASNWHFSSTARRISKLSLFNCSGRNLGRPYRDPSFFMVILNEHERQEQERCPMTFLRRVPHNPILP